MKRALVCLMLVATAAAAPPPSDEQKLRSDIQQVHTKLRASQAELDAANEKEKELATQLGLTQNQLEDFSIRLREVRTALTQAQTRLELLQREIRVTEARLVTNQHQLERRLVAMEMEGETSYLAVLFQSTSLTDFLNQSEFFQRLMARDQQLIGEVRAQKNALETQKAAAVKTVHEIQGLKKAFEEKVVGLQGLQDKQASVLAQIQVQRKRLEQYVSGLEHLSVAMEQRLQRLIREKSTPGNAPVSAGRYRYPVQGPISSTFGYRVHPITGETRFHSGLDFAVDTGTPIGAADNGVVIYADWYGGYGNCVIIQHGGDFSTLYGHCSEIYVKEGQRVRQGQPIAAVGSTGMSTGPHLHWEVRQAGTPVDPMGRI